MHLTLFFSVRDTGKKQNTRPGTVETQREQKKEKYCAAQKTEIKIVADPRGGLDSVYIFRFIFTHPMSVEKQNRVDGIVRLKVKTQKLNSALFSKLAVSTYKVIDIVCSLITGPAK